MLKGAGCRVWGVGCKVTLSPASRILKALSPDVNRNAFEPSNTTAFTRSGEAAEAGGWETKKVMA